MTPKERAAIQQALEALEEAREMIGYPANMVLYEEELALREALAEQAELEPILLIPSCAERGCACFDDRVDGEPVTAYLAPVQPVMQEPVAWMWACAECGTEAEDGTDCRICGSCGYHKFYKAPKVATCVCTAKTQEKVKQEQVAVLDITYGREPECYATPNADDLPEGTYRLYAAPVRTKDLTDDEIWSKGSQVRLTGGGIKKGLINYARAVIAADREKNK